MPLTTQQLDLYLTEQQPAEYLLWHPTITTATPDPDLSANQNRRSSYLGEHYLAGAGPDNVYIALLYHDRCDYLMLNKATHEWRNPSPQALGRTFIPVHTLALDGRKPDELHYHSRWGALTLRQIDLVKAPLPTFIHEFLTKWYPKPNGEQAQPLTA